MNGIKQFRKNKQGFLLVDAMIGVLVVAIGLAALAALYTYSVKALQGFFLIRCRKNLFCKSLRIL